MKQSLGGCGLENLQVFKQRMMLTGTRKEHPKDSYKTVWVNKIKTASPENWADSVGETSGTCQALLGWGSLCSGSS